MWREKRVSRVILVLGLCFFIYRCGSEEPQAPPPAAEKAAEPAVEKDTKYTEREPQPEISNEDVADPEREIKIGELLEQLASDDEKAAYHAALELALIGDETAIEPLISAFQSKSPLVRIGAIKALGSIGDPQALDILMQALSDGVVDVRRNAATGLGNVGEESAIGPLIEALKDPDDMVRENARESLKKLTNQDFPDYAAWNDWYGG